MTTAKKIVRWVALTVAGVVVVFIVAAAFCRWGVANGIALATGLATLAGVVVVFRQLQSLNQQTKLQNFAEYTRRYQQIVLKFPEDINARDFTLTKKARKDYDEVMRYMRAYYDLCFEEWYLHGIGHIEDDFWEIWLGGIKTALSKPAFRQAWKLMQGNTNFGEDFSTFVEGIIEEVTKTLLPR